VATKRTTDPKRGDPDASGALLSAIKSGHAKAAMAAIARGLDPKSRAVAESLTLSASLGQEPIVAALLAAGADPNRRDPYGYLPVIAAAQKPGVLRRLLAVDVNAAARDVMGTTALHAAAWCEPRSTKLLLDAGVDPNIRTDRGRAPLHTIAESGKPGYVSALIRSGGSVDARDRKGQTPLWLACRRGHVPMARVLLAAGADPNAVDTSGQTPLFGAATSRVSPGTLGPLVVLLHRAGANLGHRDKKQKTASATASRHRADVTQAIERLL
jgi:ankyrin repeat protein